MGWLHVNPAYADLLEAEGLRQPEDFWHRAAVITSGHPNRNVGRVQFTDAAGAFAAFLKREHRTPWKERWLNALAGFGFGSKCSREAQVLRALDRAGLPAPDWMAVGEDDQGRSFLLVRGVQEAVELREYFTGLTPLGAAVLAKNLARTLADVHNAGFDHPDLYAKHVLIAPATGRPILIDWQRSRLGNVSWRRRLRDLAALSATLHEDLVPARWQLRMLHAYLRQCLAAGVRRTPALREVAQQIRQRSRCCLRQRRFREMRNCIGTAATPRLIRIEGDALCVAAEFHGELEGCLPPWLQAASKPGSGSPGCTSLNEGLPNGRTAHIDRRCEFRPIAWLKTRLWGRPLMTPVVKQAGLLYRLERWRVRTPRVLAFGQRIGRFGWIHSFIATECPAQTIPMRDWLRYEKSPRLRSELLCDLAQQLRELHAAECRLTNPENQASPVSVQVSVETGKPCVILPVGAAIEVRRLSPRSAGTDDLLRLGEELAGCLSQTERLRFFLGYLGCDRLTLAARVLIRSLPSSLRTAGPILSPGADRPIAVPGRLLLRRALP